MATYVPFIPYIEGTRRSAISPTSVVQPTGYGVGTAALNEDQVLRDLLARMQSFTSGSVTDIAGADTFVPPTDAGNGIGGEISGPTSTGGPQLDPSVLTGIATVAGPVAQITGNEKLGLLANMTGLAGGIANADPATAALSMTKNFANLAGANPFVTSIIGALIGAARDPVDYTPQDIAGKILDIALSATPLNLISSILTGKTIGGQLKGALTPVETAVPGGSVSDLLAEQANQLAKETNSDPLDALMSITNSFNTGPTEALSPGMQMTDLAASMIGMPADPGIAAIAMDPSVQGVISASDILSAQDAVNAEPPASVDLSEYGPSLADMLAMQEAFNAETSATMDSVGSSSTSGLDLTSIDAGIAAFGMDTGDGEGEGDGGGGMGGMDGNSVW